MNHEGEPTVHDLPVRERVKAYLPATSALLAILAIAGLAIGWWTQQQRDNDRRAFEKRISIQARTLADTQRAAHLAQLRADGTRRLSDARFAYSFNKLACTLRSVADQSIKRLEATKPPKYKEAEAFWVHLRATTIPIPDRPSTCAGLPKKPPPDTAPPTPSSP